MCHMCVKLNTQTKYNFVPHLIPSQTKSIDSIQIHNMSCAMDTLENMSIAYVNIYTST
jgi:hypothetical protein